MIYKCCSLSQILLAKTKLAVIIMQNPNFKSKKGILKGWVDIKYGYHKTLTGFLSTLYTDYIP